jgi:ribonuclease T
LENNLKKSIANRFRGFYPVVIDLETAGFDAKKNPILELAAVTLQIDEQGQWGLEETFHHHIIPFAGSTLDMAALEFTGIQPDNPFRFAISEEEALTQLFDLLDEKIKYHRCERAVMVAHNATFDQSFIQAAVKRCKLTHDPFHRFTTFDTATLCGLAFGQTVLAKAIKASGFEYDKELAHSAKYDAEMTAKVFCHIVNRWNQFS